MENKIYSLIRVTVAGVAILSGTAVLNLSSAPVNANDSVKAVATLNDGPAPIPTCNPRDPNCQMPMMGW